MKTQSTGPASGSQICAKCGAEILKAMVRCRECGTPRSSPAKPTAAKAVVAPSSIRNSGSEQLKPEDQDSASQKKRQHKQKQSTAASSQRVCSGCDHCGKEVRAPLTLAGQEVRCPDCGHKVRLPQIKSIAAEAPSSGGSAKDDDRVLRICLSEAIQVAIQNVEHATLESRTNKDQARQSHVKKLLRKIELATDESRSTETINAARKALLELAELESVTAGEALGAQLLKLPDQLRTEAIRTLGKLRATGSYEAILRTLLSSSKQEVEAAIQALGCFEYPESVRPLLLVQKLLPEHRIRASSAIVKIGESALPVLLEIIENSPDEALRYTAMESLKGINSPKCVETLCSVVQRDRTVLRQLAVEILGQTEHPKIHRVLVKLIDDPDDQVRALAVGALARRPENSILPSFVKSLEDSAFEVRISAMRAIGEIGDKSSVPTLLKYLDDSNSDIQIAAAKAIARLGDKRVTSRILKLLEHEVNDESDSEKLRSLVRCLQQLRDPRAVLPLCELLENEDAKVRRRIAEALGVIGDSAARSVLEKHLQRDSSDEVRAAAAQALGVLGDAAAIPALMNALYEVSAVRVKALIALGRLKSPSIGPALKEMLTDPLPSIRYQAINILAELGDAAYVRDLEPLVDDADEMVQRAAMKALVTLGDERSEKEIRKAAAAGRRKRAATNVGHLLLPNALAALFVGLPRGLVTGAVGLLVLVLLGAGIFFWSSSGSSSETVVVRGYVGKVGATSDGRLAVVSRTRGLTETWDLTKNQQVWSGTDVPLASGVVASLATKTALVASGKSVFFYDFSPEGALSNPVEQQAHPGPVAAVVASANRKYAATFDARNAAILWDLGTRQKIGGLTLPDGTHGVAVSNDGELVAGGDDRGTVKVWGVKTGDIVFDSAAIGAAFKPPSPVKSVAFSADMQYLAVVSASGTVQTFDLSKQRSLAVYERLGANAWIAFNAQNELICVASKIQKLSDLARGKFEIIADSIRGRSTISFSADSGTLVAGSDDDFPVTVLDLQTGKSRELDTE